MKTMDYQMPRLWISTFEKDDVITTSGEPALDEKMFDKGVEDFFGD